MVAVARLQVQIPRDNGLPEDIVTNTWYFMDDAASSVSAVEAQLLADNLWGFYDDFQSWFSTVVASPITISVYDMGDSEPRAPVLEDTYTFTPPSNGGLPAENAICLSFEATPISGVSQRNRRGRIYLGPLAEATLSTSESGGDYRIASAFLTAIDNFYTDMLTDMIADGWVHVIYSPTLHAAGPLASAVSTASLRWVDNTFDHQRRRGAKPTSRVLF